MIETEDRDTGTRKNYSIELPTIGLIGLCYSVWAGAAFWLYALHPAAALAMMAVAAALHSSLQHEILHGHPTRNRYVNEALVFMPLGLWFPFRRFREMHLRHHNDEKLTDPYDDPESFYRAAYEFERLPDAIKALFAFNNTLAGRLIVGPALMIIAFAAGEIRKIQAGNQAVRNAWILHLIGMVPVALALKEAGIPFWLYACTSAYGGLSLIAIRTFAEHKWSERPDGRTIIVERSPLSFLFLNNNLHLVHHKLPNIAWYDLPAHYRARRDEWIERNGGYVFRSYGELFRAFAFRQKEQVVHPVLRREPEPARQFHPAPHVPGAVRAPDTVPAEPAKK